MGAIGSAAMIGGGDMTCGFADASLSATRAVKRLKVNMVKVGEVLVRGIESWKKPRESSTVLSEEAKLLVE